VGLKTVYAPYKTNTQALTDLLQGLIDFIAYDATWAITQHRAGRIRILAATAARRSAALPEIPTLAELERQPDDAPVGRGGPAGTPKAVVDKLAAWFNQITAMRTPNRSA
jgi:tripartite-type tricarboxylate transporter receptor subunit TctC